MIKFSHLIVAAAAMAPLTGCMAEGQDVADGTVADEGAAVSCPNAQGTNAMIAALAVAIGTEMHRWQVTKDLYIFTGTYSQQQLGITSTGLAQCSNGCKNVKSLLSYQDARTDQTLEFKGGEKLSAYSYAARLVAGFGNQKVCEGRVDNHRGDNCPAEAHKLTVASVAPGGCDTMVTYNATNLTGGALAYPGQLHNKLLWAENGGFEPAQLNPYIGFSATGSTVSIDPTGGLTPPTPAPPAPNSCWDGCSIYSETNIATQCCLCNGATKTLKQAALDPTGFSFNCR
jgi:hypothetical protein